ncbi:MAG: glycosyltransferase [Cyanobacteria bacterium J06606_4]
MKPLNVLVSAYACQPNMGSEPGVGWHTVQALANHHHRIWVLTRESNRDAIETFYREHDNATGITFAYCDPPGVTKLLRPAQVPHYYFWQLAAYGAAKKLHQQHSFDIVHHVTYVRYSTPSFLSLLPVPFIWGPVGGGEQAPAAFWADFNLRARVYERLRRSVHLLGELDPFTRMTAQRSQLVRATTQETAARLQKLGAKTVEICGESGLSTTEIDRLSDVSLPGDTSFRVMSMARLLHWKGLHLGIRAFAKANLPKDAEYWIAGEGPERQALEQLADRLNVSEQIKFLGRLPRAETLAKLSQCHLLMHPSLHDSGGWVCLEAMATGRPVICLDTGGPATQVTEQTGIKVPAHYPQQVVEEWAEALCRLSSNIELRHRLGEAGRQRVRDYFSWETKSRQLAQLYLDLAEKSSTITDESLSCVS